MRTLRVASYNVHKCQGVDGRVRPDRIARVLEEINADIVGLQEVVSHPERRPEDHQACFLAEACKMDYRQVSTRKHLGGVYGNVILTRFPILLHENVDITRLGREERSVQRVDHKVEGRHLHVFNLHLGTSFFERRHQARSLMENTILRAHNLEGERIVIGDLNEWTRGLVTRTLTQELRRVDLEVPMFRKRTFPALFPLFHLDYIYYEHTLRVRDAFFHHSRLAMMASDHLPLVADFAL